MALVCAATSVPARADRDPSQKAETPARRAAAKASAAPAPASAEGLPATQTMSAAQREKTARQVTGHSIQDLQNMSDAQLDALERDLKRQYTH